MTQPESLRLADWLDNYRTTPVDALAAAELRRLYAENKRLRETCKDFLDQITALRTAMGDEP